MKVAYLGPAHTFTESIAKTLFPSDELIPMQPIRQVIMAVEQGTVDRGVVPLENFYNGHVIHTLDSLSECQNTKIIAEKALTVVHCLGAHKDHSKIHTIYSKDQALDQCALYLHNHFPLVRTVATASTSEAAQFVFKEELLDSAVIASESAIKDAGLYVVDRDLCPHNRTRFIVLGNDNVVSKTGDDKTILSLHPPIRDTPGVLSHCLNILGSLGINLESIYSRPDGNKGYFFYVELDGHSEDTPVTIAIDALRCSLDPKNDFSDSVKVLGSFMNSHWKDEN